MCPSPLAHATHIQGDESAAEQVSMKSLLWMDLVQQRLLNSSPCISAFNLHN